MNNEDVVELLTIDENNNINQNDNKNKKDKKPKKKRKKLIIGLSSAVGLFGIALFLLYGPWPGFRNLWITTAMTTMNHQYLATALY